MSAAASIAQLGDIMQMAYVPGDCEKALKFWTRTIGAGPFFSLEHVKLEHTRYRGEPVEIDFSIMLGYWGDMQIELIRQHNQAPSIFKDWRDEDREGLHHVCVLVDDMKAARGVCAAMGGTVLQEALVPGGGEVIYLDPGDGPGSLVELLNPAPGTREFFKMMREAHRSWDGTEAVRSLG
ncbi:MAG: VOC family protein [Deltaproteobacteria bacterium]|jgi:methylmalonyl-CoA/ethylmalonyl-CoA epimerase|nr:VOC family protein [Deltaproteobacteria bacterium]